MIIETIINKLIIEKNINYYDLKYFKKCERPHEKISSK